jgi:hypothetical protein
MYSNVKTWRSYSSGGGGWRSSKKYSNSGNESGDCGGGEPRLQSTRIVNMDDYLIDQDSDDETYGGSKSRGGSVCHKDDVNTNNVNINECMIQLAQNLLVPMFFSLCAITLSYLSISMFSCFDSIRIYCLFVCKLKRRLFFSGL